jgi:transposase
MISNTPSISHLNSTVKSLLKETACSLPGGRRRRDTEIYAIEAQIRGNPASGLVAVRQAETKPLMEALWSWLMERLEAAPT